MKEERLKQILIFISAIVMLSFCLTPFVYMLIISFTKNPELGIEEIISNFTLSNYFSILTSETLHFLDYLKNSIIISIVSSVSCVFIAILAAYSISRMNFPFKRSLLLFVLSAAMFPQVSLIPYIFKFMVKLKLINSYSSLIFPYISFGLPLSLWLLVSYFSQVPKELDKAALIDGCSRWQALLKIVLPVCTPAIFSAILLTFIFSFNEFIFALLLTTDYHARTIPVGIALFEGLYGRVPWAEIMAASTLAIFPTVILVVVFQRYIIRGLTEGAIKG